MCLHTALFRCDYPGKDDEESKVLLAVHFGRLYVVDISVSVAMVIIYEGLFHYRSCHSLSNGPTYVIPVMTILWLWSVDLHFHTFGFRKINRSSNHRAYVVHESGPT